MRLFVGTSGFAYKEWKGKFYPPDISPKEMLRYYSSQFNSVEINNTFYRMPNRELLKGWSDQVPEGFLFALKAPRIITHIKRLKNVQQEIGYFIETASELGPKLGPLLFQFPPAFAFDPGRLEGFVGLLRGVRATVEFRNPSWVNGETLSILRSSGIALCMSDRELDNTDGADTPASEIVATTDWGYLRLRGPEYSDADLADWRRRVLLNEWTDAFVYFKHESEGAGPRMSMTFVQP